MSKKIAQPSYSTVDPDEEYVCPYDPVHRVSAKRFPIHLTKCRKIHNAKDFVSCPFNARHEVPRQELAYHISTCLDKEVIRQDIIDSAPSVLRSSNRPLTPPPSQGLMTENEDWDSEAVCESFIPSNAHKFDDAEKVDSYAVVQTMHEIQNELHAASRATQVDISKMTPAQRKNYKRSLKRQQKREEEDGSDDEQPEMTEQERINEIVKRHHLLVDGGGFVDFISGLNIYCQQEKVNVPRYQEGPGVGGGFGFQVIIKTSIYSTNKNCKTKKEAKQNAAMVAMLALDIQFDSGPLPNRKYTPLTANERERMRQTQEQQLLLQPKQAGYQQTRPVLQPPSSFSSPPVPSANNVKYASNPPPGFQSIQQPMDSLSIESKEPDEVDDGWTTVHSKKTAAKGVNPVFEYSMKVAGRGRGRGVKSS